MTPKDLKNALLQEAVQGKLVPQIASEGNSRDLLEEIKKEKAKVAGKASSTSFVSKTRADEIPFDIPQNWCWYRLSELCNLYTGDSINETEKKLKYTNVKEGRFYIGTKDVNFDQTINYDNGIKIPFEKDNFRIAPKNTVLMCIEGGSAGRKTFLQIMMCVLEIKFAVLILIKMKLKNSYFISCKVHSLLMPLKIISMA